MIRFPRPALAALALSLGILMTVPVPAMAAEPLFAKGTVVSHYWDNFREYWSAAFKNKSAVTLTVLGVGAVALFIITRGKWAK